jgi:hypothetical protein
LDVPIHGRPGQPQAPAWIRGADETVADHISQAQLDADSVAAITAKRERKQEAQRQRELEDLARQHEEQRREQEQQRRLVQEKRSEAEEAHQQYLRLLLQQMQAESAREQEQKSLQQERQERQREDRRLAARNSPRRNERELHNERKAALLKRQRELTSEVVQIVTRDTGIIPWTIDEGDPEHASGVSVFINSEAPVAVVCPVAGQITPEVADRLARTTIYVEDEGEYRRVAKKCLPSQKIIALHAEPTLW